MEGTNANRLKDMKDSILALWMERSLKEVSSARTGPTLALQDSIPIYLDHLSDALATNRRMDFKSVFDRGEEAKRIGKLHGADRASNRSYLLTEVIFEYHILREVIFQILESEGPVTQAQRDIILDSIEQAVNDAAVEFCGIHAEIQQKFINTLTHDLKTPITAAKMNADLILMRIADTDPLKGPAKRIVRNLQRLATMIHDLLDASRVRAGEALSLQYIDCDLQVMIREVVEEMAAVHGDQFVLVAD